jgi:hypothetical protein
VVKDGAIVVTDRLARRFAFPLDGPDAPQSVVSFYYSPPRASLKEWWAVVDWSGQAILDGNERDWNAGDFAGLAEAAGLERSALAPKYDKPPHRHDYVDFHASRTPLWLGINLMLLFPVVVLMAIFGLWDGYPWLWPALCIVTTGLYLGREIRDQPIIEANCAALPPDERPAPEPPPPNRLRSAAILAAVAFIPPAVAYLLQ